MEFATLAFLSIAGIVIAAILNGWALSIIWGWFVVPLFGLPSLSVPAAIGLALTLNLFVRPEYDEKRYQNSDLAEITGALIGKGLLGPLVVLGLGWIVKQFI